MVSNEAGFRVRVTFGTKPP